MFKVFKSQFLFLNYYQFLKLNSSIELNLYWGPLIANILSLTKRGVCILKETQVLGAIKTYCFLYSILIQRPEKG